MILDPIPTPEDILIARDERAIIDRALARLAPRYERVVRMHYGIGCEPVLLKQIGAEMGFTRSNAWVMEQKAFFKLKLYKHNPIRELEGKYSERRSSWKRTAAHCNLYVPHWRREEAAAAQAATHALEEAEKQRHDVITRAFDEAEKQRAAEAIAHEVAEYNRGLNGLKDLKSPRTQEQVDLLRETLANEAHSLRQMREMAASYRREAQARHRAEVARLMRWRDRSVKKMQAWRDGPGREEHALREWARQESQRAAQEARERMPPPVPEPMHVGVFKRPIYGTVKHG